MSKGLEVLEVIGFHPIDYDGKKYTRIKDEFDEEFDIVEKELKALEIIKEKGINVFEIKFSFSLEEYNICKGKETKELTQEEYDLLREVLLCK